MALQLAPPTNLNVPAPLQTLFSTKGFVAANTDSQSLYRRGDYTVWSFEDVRLADEVPEYRAMMTRRKKTRLEKRNKMKLEAKEPCPGDEDQYLLASGTGFW